MRSISLSPPSSPLFLLGSSQEQFRKNFDCQPFPFTHCFVPEHPLFQRDRLRQLMENPVTRAHIHFDAGEVRVEQRWDAVPRRALTMEEAFDQIDNAGAWMNFRNVQLDPAYDELLRECMREVKDLCGHPANVQRDGHEAMIFITSPNRITSYHLDRGYKFLMQVRGTKTIHVFDREDREITPEFELEAFWSRDSNAAVYKPQYEDRAHVFHMTPGTGAHIPVNCPHWLKNGDNVSISFSIGHQHRDSSRKLIYQANYYLRKMGMQPTPPGRSLLLDQGKCAAMSGGLRARDFFKRQTRQSHTA